MEKKQGKKIFGAIPLVDAVSEMITVGGLLMVALHGFVVYYRNLDVKEFIWEVSFIAGIIFLFKAFVLSRKSIQLPEKKS